MKFSKTIIFRPYMQILSRKFLDTESFSEDVTNIVECAVFRFPKKNMAEENYWLFSIEFRKNAVQNPKDCCFSAVAG